MTNLTLSSQQTDYLCLDGSTSMLGPNWNNSCRAIDSYVDQLKLELVNSHIFLSVFTDRHIDTEWRNEPIGDWVSLRDSPIEFPGGGTPLYDAINVTARKLRDLDPAKASAVFLTDGEATRSEFTTLEQARAIISWMQAKGWQVTFIGCEFANHKLAGSLGLLPSQAIGVQGGLLSQMARSLGKKRGNYSRTGAPMHWSEAEQQQFGGYLAPPKASNASGGAAP